ncbi:response regulator [Sphingomonas sp. PAMC 26605]|uniref:response regulator n=1 Tax=Sphingomonas sp. PAMC 26605 TaxID=1112214 RepID=UPI00026CDE54|nr:response regulator [Sphingomonas sp. PAMC 26605]
MSASTESSSITPAILIVDSDIISRHVIADYLRHCGYAVVEASTTEEAITALREASLGIDVILCDVGAVGSQPAFGLAHWVRSHQPQLEVRLAGSLEGVANTAADLCESGPHLNKPYEPEAVVDYVKRLRAARNRAKEPS